MGETGAGVGAEPQDGSTVVSWTAPSFDGGNIQVESEPGEFTEMRPGTRSSSWPRATSTILVLRAR